MSIREELFERMAKEIENACNGDFCDMTILEITHDIKELRWREGLAKQTTI